MHANLANSLELPEVCPSRMFSDTKEKKAEGAGKTSKPLLSTFWPPNIAHR
jgi:hypothetical protein